MRSDAKYYRSNLSYLSSWHWSSPMHNYYYSSVIRSFTTIKSVAPPTYSIWEWHLNEKKKGHLLSLCDRKPLCYSMKCIYFLPITHKKISAVILFLSHNPINLNAALHLKVAGLFFLFLCVPCVFHTKKCLFCYKWQKENLKGCWRIIKAPFYSIPGRIRLIVLLTKELESVNIVSAGRSEKYLLCSRVDYSEGGNNPTELQKLAISPIHFQNPDVFNLLSLNLMVFLFMPMNPFYHALSC